MGCVEFLGEETLVRSISIADLVDDDDLPGAETAAEWRRDRPQSGGETGWPIFWPKWIFFPGR